MIVCPWNEIKRYESVLPGLAEAIQAVEAITDWTPRTIALSDGNKILVQENTTKDAATQKVETHRNYLDIQYLVQGEEVVGWAPVSTLTPADEYNPVKDKQMYAGHVDFMRIAQGYCYVAYPEDGHMPGVHLDVPKTYRKLVIKLKV
jgi:YhcH/YjgK/YiaL family protein